ncbi:mycothione reductase [Terracoccus luteus]|uniref:Mycothione reductase n=1 Tax=Terracoccus luteus TaxID=53356 RepID=A0A839PZH8_9MICO|nr:mycothione reductase [Terracoccus luteus]MBB2985791.1 mycothione reductase [Terracoccus luteus]MCP2171443.1 mycothione reductase [Terracoccus luteus]
MTAHYDLAIIGTGSGNSLVTPDFDDKLVAVIESGRFGGTCLNVGCIPTKMFVYAADTADHVTGAARYGVDATLDGVRWTDVRDRIFGRIDPIAEGGKQWRIDGPNTTAYLGRARFTGERELTVSLDDGGEAVLTADQVVIATGGHPVVPPVVEQSGVPFHTSDTIMRVDALPKRMVVVGGGYIACEMAHVFSSFGTEVTILARGDRLLRHLDDDLSERFTEIARGHWDVRTGTEVTALETVGDGIRATLGDGSTVEADLLLVATGRAPSTPDLHTDKAGVELHDDGRVRVDDYGRTTASGVWALGDVSSPYQLKHVANAEARAVAHNLVHPDDLRAMPHDHVPAAVFTNPQIASVGLTESECREQGLRYTTKVQAFGDVAYGWAMEDTTGICKVIADPATGTLLGAHLLGPFSSSLVQPLVQAMAFGTTAHELARGQYWIHPALAEVVENALLGLELDGD